MPPKVEFKIGQIKEYIEEIIYFLKTNQKVILFEKYPELKELTKKENYNKEKIIKFFKQKEKEFNIAIKQSQEDFQKSWNEINDKVMIALENVNETKWPKELKIISAKITLNPICPRYLEDYSFDIHFAFPNILMKRITLHEISHFIFFKKFKEIYPKINPKRFEYPNIVWNLSEIVPLMILGDKRIQEIIEHEPSIYNVYKKLKINEKNILEILQNFYNKRKNFTDFIKTSYNFMKKHEKEIKTKFEMI